MITKEIWIGQRIFIYTTYESLFEQIVKTYYYKNSILFKDLIENGNENHFLVKLHPTTIKLKTGSSSAYKLWGKLIKELCEIYKNEDFSKDTKTPIENKLIFNLILRINNFLKNEINNRNLEFNVIEDSTDGRDISKSQEILIINFLISKNDEAKKYGIEFLKKRNENNRSKEDMLLIDLFNNNNEHLANIKSKNDKMLCNIGKSSIFGYVLTGKNKVFSNKSITKILQEKSLKKDRTLNDIFYFYLTYQKDSKNMICHELTHFNENEIKTNPSNCLQSKLSMESVYRNNNERYEFLHSLWEQYRNKVMLGFEEVVDYV